jgi:RND family efflux transporter MFP subunit
MLACQAPPPPPPPAVVQVRTSVVHAVQHQKPLELTAKVRAAAHVDLVAEVDGRVIRIARALGDPVQAGDAIIVLDAEAARLRASQAAAELDQALVRAGVDSADALTRLQPQPHEVPSVARARVDAREAERALARSEELRGKRVIADAEHDAVRLRKDVADITLAAARDEHRVAVATARAKHAAAQLTQKQVRDAQIRAPFDGVVTEQLVELGAWVRAGSVVARMTSTGSTRLVIDAPESALGALNIGTELVVINRRERTIATVDRIGSVIDEATRTIAVEATLADGPQVPVGSVVQVQATTGVPVRAVLVPESALVQLAGVQKIFVVAADGQTVTEQRVQLLGKEAGNVWLTWLDGEPPDACTVVVGNAGRLSQGARVQAQPATVTP